MSNLAFMRDGDNEIVIVATYTDELPASVAPISEA